MTRGEPYTDEAPVPCAHGYGPGELCPDCDSPAYLPAVLSEYRAMPAGALIHYGPGPMEYIAGADRATLLAIIADTALPAIIRGGADRELDRRYPCADCGAPAGELCRPEYGCARESRREPSPADEVSP